MATPIPVIPYDDAAFILGNLGVSGGIARTLTLAEVGAALPSSGLPGSIAVRQAIQNSPVDANGRASFLTSSGLVVSGSGISGSTPLILAVTDNPNSSGQPVDRIIRIITNPSWPTLAANTTSYLFIEDDGAGILSYTVSTLAPSYGEVRPSSPGSGQFHYDTRHRGRPVVWDGSAWVERLIICVGEAVTGASTVTTTRSYAILGRWSALIPGQQNRIDILSHNLGVSQDRILLDCVLIAQSAVVGYNVGDVIPMHLNSRITSPDSRSPRGVAEVLERNVIRVLQADLNEWFVCNKGTGALVLHTPRSDFSVFYKLMRAF